MSFVDRKTACLTQAAAYLEKADADPLNREYWTAEASKWLERATTPSNPVVVTIDAEPHSAKLVNSPSARSQ